VNLPTTTLPPEIVSTPRKRRVELTGELYHVSDEAAASANRD
jgi:hypothetical protein